MKSQAIILASMTVVTIDSGIHSLTSNKTARVPESRIVIGGFLVTIGLLVFSEFNEELSEAMAILILLATIFGPSGGSLTKLVERLSKDGLTPSTNVIPGVGAIIPKVG